jgi:hypothetical protein
MLRGIMKRSCPAGHRCAILSRPCVQRRPRASRDGNRPRTAISRPGYHCSPDWRLGRPRTARTWHVCWGATATPDRPLAGARCRRGLEAGLASLAEGLRRPEGCASPDALRQGVAQAHGVQITAKTHATGGRPRVQTTRHVPRPSHTPKSCGYSRVPDGLSSPPPAGHPTREPSSTAGLQPRRQPPRPPEHPPAAPPRPWRAASWSSPACLRVVLRR